MKFLATADLHLRETTPRYRKDKYFVSQYEKIKWILDQSIQHRASILIAGDIFDTPKLPYSFTNIYLEILLDHPLSIYACVGQHDLRYHVNNLDNTPMGTLIAGNVITNLSQSFIQISGWGEKIPKEEKMILLTHRCVTPKEPPFFLEDAVSAESMLKSHPQYQYIISGDYHTPHVTQIKDRWLINPGSVMRSNKDQEEHKPRVYLIDTTKGTVEPIFIPIKPASEVFDFAKMDREDKTDKAVISEFVKAIQVKANRPNFPRILQQVVEKADPNKQVKSIISDTMESSI